MTKLHTKTQKLTSRRAVAPVIATLLLVAIAVVGGSIIFVFSQGFFSQAQVSGSPQIESVEIIGYDASDVLFLTLHDGNNSTDNNAAFDQQFDDDGLIIGDRIAVYLQNQSAQRVTFTELSVAGVVYDYVVGDGTLDVYDTETQDGEYVVVSNGLAAGEAVTKTDPIPTLEAGEEATIILQLERALSLSRDAQFKVETGTGSIFVGTLLAGQQSG